MQTQQRQLVFMVAGGVTVLLAIIGILYLAGAVIATGAHDKRAVVCLALAAIAAVVTFFTRPRTQIAG